MKIIKKLQPCDIDRPKQFQLLIEDITKRINDTTEMANISGADGTLADITSKFNLLLVAMREKGLLENL